MKTFCFLLLLILPWIFTPVAAQSTGDIMIVGFQGDGDGTLLPPDDAPSLNCGDGFAFVCLADIPAGTGIYFTESEYTGGAFEAGEGDILWNSGAEVIPQGSIVLLVTHGESEATDCGGVSASHGSFTFEGTGTWTLSSSAEEIYAYTGSLRSPSTWLTVFLTNGSGNSPPAGVPVVDLTGQDADTDIAIFGDFGCLDDGTCLSSIQDPTMWLTQNGEGFNCCDGESSEFPDDLPGFEPANDTDGDGVLDIDDNCPSTPNPTQADTDGDGIGDACELANLYFSEYLEGSGNIQILEIYNDSNTPVDLNGYEISIYFDGSTTPGFTIPLIGTLDPYRVHLLINENAEGGIAEEGNQTGDLSFDGNDAIELSNSSQTLDLIGQIGSSSIFGEDLTAVRKFEITTGNPSGTLDLSVEWDLYPQDFFGDIGKHSNISNPSDIDGDGVPDYIDNCPGITNPNQADSDGDGIGDACDTPVPVPQDDLAVTDEDTPVIISVLDNDESLFGGPLNILDASDPTNGTIVINSDETITYTPNPDFFGDDSFTYIYLDSEELESEPGTVNITVIPVNDLPVGLGDIASVEEDGSILIDVLANDTDVDGDVLMINDVSMPSIGTVEISDGAILFTPLPDFNGSDEFTYTINDGTVISAPVSVTIDVIPVNDAPFAIADDAITLEETAITIDVLANDYDIESDALTIESVSDPDEGDAQIDGSQITFTPAPGVTGVVIFEYVISDGQASSEPGVITVEVQNTNDPPVGVADVATTDEDVPVEIDVLANDSDPDGDVLAIVDLSTPDHGSVSHSAGKILYTPGPNYNGTDQFTYRASDGTDASDPVTVDVVIAPVNDAPFGKPDAVSTLEEMPVTFDVGLNDRDLEDDPFYIVEIRNAKGASGTTSFSGTLLTFTPDENENGLARLYYVLSDGMDESEPIIADVNIEPVNDPPTAVDDIVETLEDTPVDIYVLKNDFDVDDLVTGPRPKPTPTPKASAVAKAEDGGAAKAAKATKLQIADFTSPVNGTVTLMHNYLLYTPNPDFFGDDQFSYTITDGLETSNSAVVTIEVIPVNDGPIAIADDFVIDYGSPATLDILENDSDDGGLENLSITFPTLPGLGTVTVNSNNTITYTHDGSYNFADAFDYQITDAEGLSATTSVNLTILAPDADGDGIIDSDDNCVNTPNPDQTDTDADGIGDACDEDDDNDGCLDTDDSEPLIAGNDADGDGIIGGCDVCDEDPNNWTAEGCTGCIDADGDGFFTGCDIYGSIMGPDCNDANAAINPETVWYADADGDGFGNPEVSTEACEQPTGFILDGNDTDDTNPYLNPNNAAPIANAGTDQSGTVGDPVSLDGTGSSDPDNDLLNYDWVIISAPVGSSAAITGSGPYVGFTPDLAGAYTIQLIVDDGFVFSEPDEVIVTVLSAENAIKDLGKMIDELVKSGSISRFQGFILSGPVDRALKFVQKGNTKVAIIQLYAFQFRVKLFALFGLINRSEAAALLETADEIIDTLYNGGGSSARVDNDVLAEIDEHVPEKIPENQITVYPNPFHSEFSVEFFSLTDATVHIELFDINGKRVYDFKTMDVEEFRFYRWKFTPMMNVPSGLYLLTIKGENVDQVHKLVYSKE